MPTQVSQYKIKLMLFTVLERCLVGLPLSQSDNIVPQRSKRLQFEAIPGVRLIK